MNARARRIPTTAAAASLACTACRPFAACAAFLAFAGCATTSTSSTRELPLGLASIGTALDGCATDEASDDGVVRMRCAHDVVLAVRARPASAGEPQFRAEAYGLAQTVGGRLVWDQIVVPTEGPSGLVDRALVLEAGGSTAKATLLGVVRSIGNNRVEELWCSTLEDAGVDRCKSLVGAVLGTSIEATAAAANDAKPATAEVHAPEPPAGAATVFGRALSLPTTCKVKARADGADAVCQDGASLTWSRFGEINEATQAVSATLAALGDDSDGDSFACTIVGEPAQCEAHNTSVAGVTYLDGKPVAVLCVGAKDPIHHSLCRAVIVPK